MLTRLVHALVLGVIFFGLTLMLFGLSGSARQAVSGLADVMSGASGLEIPGASLAGPVRAAALADRPPTRTPFMPITSTAPVLVEKPTDTAPAARIPVSGPVLTPTPASTPTPPPTPTPTPRPVGAPERIIIERIGLDAPVVIIPRLELYVGKDVFEHWQPPAFFAAGWHEGSAFLGEKGNTVLSGHHNIAGKVFAHLLEIERGDRVTVQSSDHTYLYVVTQVMYFEERYVSLEQRIQNAHWILPSDDERLTLVTCWPPDSNTYRLIIVAVPDD